MADKAITYWHRAGKSDQRVLEQVLGHRRDAAQEGAGGSPPPAPTILVEY